MNKYFIPILILLFTFSLMAVLLVSMNDAKIAEASQPIIIQQDTTIVNIVDNYKLKSVNRKYKKSLYTVDSLGIECHEKDAIIDNPLVFKKYRGAFEERQDVSFEEYMKNKTF